MFDYPKGNPSKNTLPLLCWDIYVMGALHHHSGTFEEDLLVLSPLKKQHQWQLDLSRTLQIPYQALVLTDAQQEIIWVNGGFEKMTGYESTFAIGKHPSFLQGSNSAVKSKSTIHEKLLMKKKVTETIINYRKDGSQYLCSLQIFPLVSNDSSITHFLALESAI